MQYFCRFLAPHRLRLAATPLEIDFGEIGFGVVKYEIPALGLMGEIPIQRTTLDNVALCEALSGK